MRSDFTVEIYKKDARCKSGEKLFKKIDYKDTTKDSLASNYESLTLSGKYSVRIYETWVTKKNLISGLEFKERYDTPHYCSPSSESYWSM